MKNRNFNKLFSFSFKNCNYVCVCISECMVVHVCECLLGESCGAPQSGRHRQL